jgi:hypothetical protein
MSSHQIHELMLYTGIDDCLSGGGHCRKNRLGNRTKRILQRLHLWTVSASDALRFEPSVMPGTALVLAVDSISAATVLATWLMLQIHKSILSKSAFDASATGPSSGGYEASVSSVYTGTIFASIRMRLPLSRVSCSASATYCSRLSSAGIRAWRSSWSSSTTSGAACVLPVGTVDILESNTDDVSTRSMLM